MKENALILLGDSIEPFRGVIVVECATRTFVRWCTYTMSLILPLSSTVPSAVVSSPNLPPSSPYIGYKARGLFTTCPE